MHRHLSGENAWKSTPRNTKPSQKTGETRIFEHCTAAPPAPRPLPAQPPQCLTQSHELPRQTEN